MRRLCLLLGLWLTACGAVTPAPTALPTIGVTVSAPTHIPTREISPTPVIATPTPLPTEPTSPPFQIVQVVQMAEAMDNLDGVINTAAQKFGWQVGPTREATQENIVALAESGVGIIVANGSVTGGKLCDLARQFPETYFVSLYSEACTNWPTNWVSVGGERSRWDEMSFLAGMAAGFATETQRVAVVANTTAEGFNYRNGYLHGVRYTCPRCEVSFVEAGDMAAGLYTDVVFVAPGETQAAVLLSAAQAGAWVIGAGSDVYATVFADGAAIGADKVLTSIWLDAGAAVNVALQNYVAAKEGKGVALTGQHLLSAEIGAVIIAPYRASALNSLDQQEIAAALARLAEGSLDTGIDPATGAEK